MINITAYAASARLVDSLAQGMKIGSRMWRRFAPRHVVEQACQLMIRDGYSSQAVRELLGPYAARLPDPAAAIQQLAESAETIAWERHRIVIVPDGDLWADLGDIGDDDVLSADVFQYLPYDTPFIQLPKPVALALGDPNRLHQIVGAYLYGIRRDADPLGRFVREVMCPTSDPQAYTLAFKFAGVITDLDGVVQTQASPSDAADRYLDLITTTFVLWFGKETMTFAELSEKSRDRFVNKDMGSDPLLRPVEDARADTTALVRRALAFVMYLCCSNADLEVRKAHAPKAKKRRDSGGKREPVIVQAGFRVGAAIRAWRVERERGQDSAPTGRRNRPHPRRGHFHRWRIGKGRQQLSQPRYMRMLWINWKGDADVTTVKPAKR